MRARHCFLALLLYGCAARPYHQVQVEKLGEREEWAAAQRRVFEATIDKHAFAVEPRDFYILRAQGKAVVCSGLAYGRFWPIVDGKKKGVILLVGKNAVLYHEAIHAIAWAIGSPLWKEHSIHESSLDSSHSLK